MKEQTNCCNGKVERAGMDERRAMEINEAILSYAFYDMGIKQRPIDVTGISLADMLEATRMIEFINDRSRNHMMVVADERFIAAVFAMSRYQPENPDRPVRPLVRGLGRALLCVNTESSDGG